MIIETDFEKEKDFPKRKPTRLKDFDYSSQGAYFITICTQDRKRLLSEIIKKEAETINFSQVGEGLAPPGENYEFPPIEEDYLIILKPCGTIVEEQLKSIEKRFPNVIIDSFVIMPDHVHVIIFLNEKTGGASPSPTLSDVICTFKSLTSRICKQQFGIEKIFQRSFSEHIIRDKNDYANHIKYIYENPIQWYYKQ